MALTTTWDDLAKRMGFVLREEVMNRVGSIGLSPSGLTVPVSSGQDNTASRRNYVSNMWKKHGQFAADE